MPKSRTSTKEVAFREGTTAQENLPMPLVLYPNHYGAFFAFQERAESPFFFCSCALEALENALRLYEEQSKTVRYSDNIPYSLRSLPLVVKQKLLAEHAGYDLGLISHLSFQHRLCHECNRVTPSFRYCHEMYGGAFKQNYGWYINKHAFEMGIDPLTLDTLPGCSQEIRDLLTIDRKQAMEQRGTFVRENKFEEIAALDKAMAKERRKIWNVIENEVRIKFGHKKIGDAWTSETILYYIIRELYPSTEILRHHRPSFLEGLELDVFIPSMNLGVEYQGIQHFKAIPHWGGKVSLVLLKERDSKKVDLCSKAGIKLIAFNYDEPLSSGYVSKKLLGSGGSPV